MLFNSYEFILVFLPVVLAGYFCLAPVGSRAGVVWPAVVWLGVASLAFYAYWNPAFLAPLIGSIAANYCFGAAISRNLTRHPRTSRIALICGIAANLALLGYYKYANFFLSIAVPGQAGLFAQITLPLGISFFTLTQIAFLVDAYRGLAREYKLSHYLLFVTYFPHLIAGPLIHHKQVMPQFEELGNRHIKAGNVVRGLTLFTLGLAKKVLLADNLAEFSTPIFDAAQAGTSPDCATAWQAALAYTFQLYFDFSGYSDMALGISLLFGIELPANFNSPYKARNIIDFWRRWHMTLSAFLRDYLYIPLGGNRLGPARRYLNLFVTMLLGGLWHGANWTFVLWGALHGAYLIVNHGFIALRPRLPAALLPAIGVLAPVVTFLAVVIAWVPFRAESLDAARLMLAAMAMPSHAGLSALSHWGMALIGGAAAIAFLLPNTLQIDAALARADATAFARRALAAGVAMGTLFFVALTRISQSSSEFIYFQF